MFFLLVLLADDGVHDRFEDVLFRDDAVHVLDQSISLINLVVLKIVDYQVKARLWDDIDKRRQHLESILALSEYDQIVTEQIVILEHVSYRGAVLKGL